jgi:hypothetical protein
VKIAETILDMRKCGNMRGIGRLICLGATGLLSLRPALSNDTADRLREAQKLVETVRGRTFSRSVPSEPIAGARLKAVLTEKFEEGLPVPAEDYFRAAAALGALSESDLPGLKERLLDFYQAQVLAFYDPSAGKFFVSSDAAERAGVLGGAEESLVFTHELTHALQDQNLSLEKRIRDLRDDGDAQLALDALLEGEATEVMIEAAVKDLPGAEDILETALGPLLTVGRMDLGPEAAKIPDFFTEQLLFPYTEGTAFIRERKKHGGWAAIDKLWALPPRSSSEILHPDFRFSPARDLLPADKKIPLPAGYHLLYTDTLGEWTLRFLFRKAGIPDADAQAAAWRGDRFVFLKKNDRIAYFGKIRAQDPEAAQQILEAWKKAAPGSSGVVHGSDVVVFLGYEAPPI